MPEGDTVHLAATRLHAALGGQTLRRSDFRVPRWATTDLADRTMMEVSARGKHLLMRVQGGVTIHTHFKMEGTWHLYRPGSRWREPEAQARIVLTTDPWIAVGFRLGNVDVWATEEEEAHLRHLGPDVLGPDWDPPEVVARMTADPSRPIGDVLLDQSALAGVGNVYRSEICFLAGVHPATLVRDIPDLAAVVSLAKRLLEANRTTGKQITTGDPRPGRKNWVYGRGSSPCRRCGNSIMRALMPGPGGERSVYWCPTCQAWPTGEVGA